MGFGSHGSGLPWLPSTLSSPAPKLKGGEKADLKRTPLQAAWSLPLLLLSYHRDLRQTEVPQGPRKC